MLNAGKYMEMDVSTMNGLVSAEIRLSWVFDEV